MIGKGAFGEVYFGLLADVARLQKALPVAIKVREKQIIFIKLNQIKYRHRNRKSMLLK